MSLEPLFLPEAQMLSGKILQLGGSKSITNRLLVLQKLIGNIAIRNISASDDSKILQAALEITAGTVNIGHAGTAMRFLTAYFAVLEKADVILTGSERMKQRPIAPLVSALQQLGADIQYLEQEGFPPLKIKGRKISGTEISIPADVSSQFITALMLIGAKLPRGLKINLIGEITSRPYLEMTAGLMNEIGIAADFNGSIIQTPSHPNINAQKIITVESDWSSASYWYSMAAIGRQKISLQFFRKNSLQGDAIVAELYRKYFGVQTVFDKSDFTIDLIPHGSPKSPAIIFENLNSCPDIAQTICVTAAALKIPFHFTGLATLKIKETDRLFAMQQELNKIGCATIITDQSIKTSHFFEVSEHAIIETYHDHRMAMSFAPMSLKQNISISDPEVVTKSYPDFWRDLKTVRKG